MSTLDLQGKILTKTPLSWRYCVQNRNKTRKNYWDYAFQIGIEGGGFEITCTWNPSRISAIAKSNASFAF